MRAFDLGPIGASDGEFARHHPIEQHSQAVDVGRARRRPPTEELWREIQRRARHVEQPVKAGRQLGAGAEVHQDRASALLAHDVLRLDIAVDEAASVHRGERAAQIDTDERRFLRAERAASAQFVLHRATMDELHPQTDESVRLLDAVDDDDVAVVDLGEERAFAKDTA